MLVLSRKNRESIVIGNADEQQPICTITVLSVQGGKVKLGVKADATVPVHRGEVCHRILQAAHAKP